jgi:hypothetical protein
VVLSFVVWPGASSLEQTAEPGMVIAVANVIYHSKKPQRYGHCGSLQMSLHFAQFGPLGSSICLHCLPVLVAALSAL